MEYAAGSNLPPLKPQTGLSAFVKGGLGLLIFGLIDMLVSFSTAYWATWTASHREEYGGYGLWKMWHCGPNTRNTDEMKIHLPDHVDRKRIGCEVKMADSSFPAWYVATQVMQTLALGCLLSSLILLLLYMCMPKWRYRKVMSAVVGLAYSAGSLMVVAVCVFACMVTEEIAELDVSEWALSWSFSLSCTACLLIQIAASILVPVTKRGGRGGSGPEDSAVSAKDPLLPSVLQVRLPEAAPAVNLRDVRALT